MIKQYKIEAVKIDNKPSEYGFVDYGYEITVTRLEDKKVDKYEKCPQCLSEIINKMDGRLTEYACGTRLIVQPSYPFNTLLSLSPKCQENVLGKSEAEFSGEHAERAIETIKRNTGIIMQAIKFDKYDDKHE